MSFKELNKVWDKHNLVLERMGVYKDGSITRTFRCTDTDCGEKFKVEN